MDIIWNFLNLPLFCHLFTDLVFSGRIVPVFREDGNTEKWWSQERRNILNPPPPKPHHLIIIAVTNLSWVVIRLDNLSLTFQPLQLHLIKHSRLFNHPAKYHIVQIIRRYILWIEPDLFRSLLFVQPINIKTRLNTTGITLITGIRGCMTGLLSQCTFTLALCPLHGRGGKFWGKRTSAYKWYHYY